MKKEWLVKTLALGILIMFFGAGIVSTLNVNFIKKSGDNGKEVVV